MEEGAEDLLILCAKAIEKRNVAAVLKAVHALKSISSVDSDLPSERVTAYFLRALMTRAVTLLQSSYNYPSKLDLSAQDMPDNPHQVRWGERALGFNDLTHLVDMTPYYRFGYMAANGAILKAFEGMDRIHIVDFSTSHCMQWPTLIDSLADRMDGPPHVRLTVCTSTLPIPPRLHPSYKEVGHRLTLWAREKGVPFEFHILSRPLESLCISDMNLREGESLAVNCNLRLHYLGDESLGLGFGSCTQPSSGVTERVELCPRDNFLQLISYLNPAVVTLYEEDCNATSNDLVARLKESYNHEWIPFDYLATYAHHGRREHERDLGLKIENLIACEGVHRIERLESMSQWSQRLRRMNFRALCISDDVATALQEMVSDYAAGWGSKFEDGIFQILTWKGHSLAFASAWVPASTRKELSSLHNHDAVQEEIALTHRKVNPVRNLPILALKPGGSGHEMSQEATRSQEKPENKSRNHAEPEPNVIDLKLKTKYEINVLTNQRDGDSDDNPSILLQEFVAHLIDALSKAGFERASIRSSQSQNEVPSMDDILSDACVHVPVCSRNFAESTQCLKELCYMVESGKAIIPVFYYIDREHLRQIENGPFNKAFMSHQERENPEEVKNWKQALHALADIRGTAYGTRLEDKMISSIVAAIQRESMGVPEEEDHQKLDVHSTLSCRSNLSVGLSSSKRDFGDDLTEEFPDNVVLMPLDGIALIAGHHDDDSNSAAFGLYYLWQPIFQRPEEKFVTVQIFRDIISSYSAKRESFGPTGDVSFDTGENNLRFWPDMLVNFFQNKLYISYPFRVQPWEARVLVGSEGQKNLRSTVTSSAVEGHANKESVPLNAQCREVWKVVAEPSPSRESYMETIRYIEPVSSPSSPSPNPDYLQGKAIMGCASGEREEYGLMQKMAFNFSKYGYTTHVLQLTVEDDFVIFGSRLFWDLVSVSKASEIVQNTEDPQVAARELVKYALSRVISEDIEDIANVTTMVLFIGGHNTNFLKRKQKIPVSMVSEDVVLIKLLQEELGKLDDIFGPAKSDNVSLQNLSTYGETTILFHFDETNDLFEFYFKDYKSMAYIVGIGLEYGKVILEDGWQVKVIEILKQDWESAWKNFGNLSSSQNGTLLSLEVIKEDIDETKEINLFHQIRHPLFFSIAKYIILKTSVSTLSSKVGSITCASSSGGNSSSQNSGQATSSSSDGNNNPLSRMVEGMRKLFFERYNDNMRHNGDDPNGDPSGDPSRDPSDIYEARKVVTVFLELLPGGCLSEELIPDNETKKLRSQLDDTIHSKMKLVFINEPYSKEIKIVIGSVSFQFGMENQKNYEVTGRFGWFHTCLDVSLRPNNSSYSKLDSDTCKVLDVIDMHETYTMSVGEGSSKGTEKKLKLEGTVNALSTLSLKVGTDLTSSDSCSHSSNSEKSIVRPCQYTKGGFRIIQDSDLRSSMLRCKGNSPDSMIDLSHVNLSNEQYRNIVDYTSICSSQDVKFEGTWRPDDIENGPQELVEYIFEASREVQMTSIKSDVKSKKRPRIHVTCVKPPKEVENNFPLKFKQTYTKHLYLNHAMTHVNGKVFRVQERMQQLDSESYLTIQDVSPNVLGHWSDNPLVALNGLDMQHQP